VLQGAPEAIEPPADDDVEPPAPGIGDQAIEGRPAVRRAGDALVDVLSGRPAAGLDVPAEFL
jgi:hypothetical protein